MAYNGLIHIVKCDPNTNNDVGAAWKGDTDRQYKIEGADFGPEELTDIYGIDFGFGSKVEGPTAEGGGHATPFPARILMKVNHHVPLFLTGLMKNERYNIHLYLLRAALTGDTGIEVYFKMRLKGAALHKMQILTGIQGGGEGGLGNTTSQSAAGEHTDMREVIQLSFTARDYFFTYLPGTHTAGSGMTQGNFDYTKNKK